MSNQDRAAQTIYHLVRNHLDIENNLSKTVATRIAQILCKQSLLAPDLPEPDRENDREGAEWYLNGQIGYIVGGGPVIEVYCLSHQRQIFRLTFTKEEAEPTALTLLAAAQYAEEA